MALVQGGWCGHTEAKPIRADYGTWECPNSDHKED